MLKREKGGLRVLGWKVRRFLVGRLRVGRLLVCCRYQQKFPEGVS
jgi:hypothetical protein